MSPDTYDTPLSLTSQFPFCGLPLRLDSYIGCDFQCGFCYARNRGGRSGIVPGKKGVVRRVFQRAFAEDPKQSGLVGEFLRQRVPVHFGGMSDPFQDTETDHQVTWDYLTSLRDHAHPTVISTRGVLVAEEPYLSLLAEMKHVAVQFSLTSTQDSIRARLEPKTAPIRSLFRAMSRLSDRGIPVTCRWQPYVPGQTEMPQEFVRRVAAAGARHLALEHLKVPIDPNARAWRRFEAETSTQWRLEYLSAGAVREGREYILRGTSKKETILAVRSLTRAQGMTFGAADNEYQYLSDTGCCCSGVDQFPGFNNWYKHQIAHAVRKSVGKKRIRYSLISAEWSPAGSVDRFLNSHSRIGDADTPARAADHIKLRWNNPNAHGSPASFSGVAPTDEFSEDGYRVYQWQNLNGQPTTTS